MFLCYNIFSMSAIGPEYLASRQKRNLDVIGGAALAACLSPLALAVGAGLAIDTRSYPLFTQERSGGIRDNINTYKFRTLRRSMGEVASRQTFGTFDSRASSFGQFVRQTGLDEIPQLANILKGDMSLVGPRPILEDDLDQYRDADTHLFDDWLLLYRKSKPGLTGESQIHRHHYRGISDDLRIDSMRMDLNYLENASLASDLYWLSRTPTRLVRANISVQTAEDK